MLIRNKDRQALQQIFSTIKLPIEVWAYGSRVDGSAHEGSDLDLVIRSQDLTSIPAEVVILLREKIRDSNIPILVELRDWVMLPEGFHRNVESEYEVLFSNMPSTVSEPPKSYEIKTGKSNEDN